MLKLKSKAVLALLLLAGVVVSSAAVAAENSTGISMYDEKAYTKETEAAMDKMHGLFLKAFDKKVSAGEREKARREYMKIGTKLIRQMHERTMARDVKTGGALSDTEVLLSVHMSMMMLDMLSAIQEEEWRDPNM